MISHHVATLVGHDAFFSVRGRNRGRISGRAPFYFRRYHHRDTTEIATLVQLRPRGPASGNDRPGSQRSTSMRAMCVHFRARWLARAFPACSRAILLYVARNVHARTRRETATRVRLQILSTAYFWVCVCVCVRTHTKLFPTRKVNTNIILSLSFVELGNKDRMIFVSTRVLSLRASCYLSYLSLYRHIEFRDST